MRDTDLSFHFDENISCLRKDCSYLKYYATTSDSEERITI